MAGKKRGRKLPPGWYYDEDGRACFAGECFDISLGDDGAEIQFDESCEIGSGERSGAVKDAFVKAALGGDTKFKVRKKRARKKDTEQADLED